jgi:hypothetical protein
MAPTFHHRRKIVIKFILRSILVVHCPSADRLPSFRLPADIPEADRPRRL